MSEAILTFHSQLSVVMETVLKAAMFEITRLVEVSFLEEVMRSRQEVEALKQRLQRSERRLRGQEGVSRGRCEECGRGAAPRQEGTRPGVEDGCNVKEEKDTNGSHSSYAWEVPDSTPPGVSQEVPTPTRTTDLGAPEIITIDLEEDRSNSPHSTEDLKEATCRTDGDSLQGQPRQYRESEEEVWDLGPSAQQRDRRGALEALPRLKPQPHHQATRNASTFGLERASPPFPQESAPSAAAGGLESGCGLERGDNLAVCSLVEGTKVKVEAIPSEDGSLKLEEEEPSACRTQPGPGQPPHTEYGEVRDEISPTGLPRVAAPQDLPRLPLLRMEHPSGFPGRGSASPDTLNENDQGLAVSGTAELHAGEPAEGRSFSCLHCGKGFSQLRNLKDHQRYHTGNKTHSCVHCGKGFVYMCHLKVHLQSHTGERPYSCAQCGKTFTYLCNLKSHQQYHTGEKPFSCVQCGKSFRHLSHLKKHRFMHTGERPYRCVDCGKRFSANGDLKRHQRIHTR